MEDPFRVVGSSRALEQVRDLVSRAAPTTACVLITGDRGVGKELVARAIHLQSPRQSEPFVVLDCAAIPRELIENELFGQERGSSTGAGAACKGKLQEADKGSLFLDEVADMPLAAQARLFRFLEHPEVEHPGSGEPILLDVRVMAATNRNIAACIRDGSFHEDLHQRLNVVAIKVPTLRERLEDIEELTAFFLDRFCLQHNRELSLAPACQAVLRGYDWPGNVRELRNLVERVVVLARTNPVEPDELRSFMGAKTPARPEGALRTTMDEHLQEALVRSLSADRRKGRRRRRHSLSHRAGRWLKRIPRRTLATAIVVLALVFALLMMLLWKAMTGEWLFDTFLETVSGFTQ
jgi:two-component system, NtrC family, nitrogen regulation response regulator NtrX